VTFATPSLLFALLALPLLAGVYVVRQARSGRAAAAFAMPHMAPSVLPHKPGWRRHAPLLVLLLAAAALILAAAKPQRSVAVIVDRASIILATDVSGSMRATDVKPDRLTAAKLAAKAFVAKLPSRVNVGIMAFNQIPSLLQSPTADREAANLAIDGMKVSGTTASGDAVAAATRVLARISTASGSRSPAAIVLLSDGKSTRGSDPVEAASAAGKKKIPVYTVALGTANGTITGSDGQTQHVPPDPTTLAAMARASGGEFFDVPDATRLSQVYERLGKQLGHEQRQRQVTVYFAGGGLLMLLAAMAMSLRWFGRPI
jgi:Ca-activated chloride channel family protein